jgi:phosphate:Na+ symporter
MDIFDILTMLGGLCLFLFGMNVMGDSLERRAGNSLRALKADNADYKVRYQDYSRKYRLN